jgi:hypothetical protein
LNRQCYGSQNVWMGSLPCSALCAWATVLCLSVTYLLVVSVNLYWSSMESCLPTAIARLMSVCHVDPTPLDWNHSLNRLILYIKRQLSC